MEILFILISQGEEGGEYLLSDTLQATLPALSYLKCSAIFCFIILQMKKLRLREIVTCTCSESGGTKI